jgi:hypothetical protein
MDEAIIIIHISTTKMGCPGMDSPFVRGIKEM